MKNPAYIGIGLALGAGIGLMLDIILSVIKFGNDSDKE